MLLKERLRHTWIGIHNILQEKRCAVQVKELCKDSPTSLVRERLLDEAESIVNGHGEVFLTPISGSVLDNGVPADGNGNVVHQVFFGRRLMFSPI